MKRRDFLRAAAGGAGVAGAAGAAQASGSSVVANQANNTTTTAGNGTGNQTTTTSGSGGSGTTKTVTLVDYAFEGATESPLYITPGTTVKFVWETDNHNIVVESQPEGADWSGMEEIHNSGYTYEHTFQTKGTYEFFCAPHRSLGMTGTIVVNESGQPPGGGGGQATLSPHEMGVPFQAQYVGLATILMMFVTLVFTFFTLKYGGSPHASAPNKRE